MARRVSTATTPASTLPIDSAARIPRDDVVGVVVAVQQQHVAQGAGPGGVAVTAAGEVPELLVLGPEPATRTGLGERGRRGSAPGRRHRTSR